jgi:lipopolysaccharide transport system permease protein
MVIFPLALICLGLSWFLSAIGVFLRDVGQTIGIFVTGLMFLSPVFFLYQQYLWIGKWWLT